MLLAMKACPKSGPRALLLLGGVALIFSACSSDYPIHVITEAPLIGAVIPTNILCSVSGATTTATGSSAGPATVVLVLTVQNAARKTVGASARASKHVPSGKSWDWTLRANTAGFVPARCTVSTVGSFRPTTIP